MRADPSDMPKFLRGSQTKKTAIPFIAWAIGVLITAQAISIGGEALVKSMAAKKQPAKPAPVAEITRAPAVKMTRDEWDKVVEEQAKRDAGLKAHVTKAAVVAGKGSVINKAYKPGEAINILSFNESYAPEVPKTKSKGVRVTVVSETKDSNCWPLKEGSVERRNCKFSQGLSR